MPELKSTILLPIVENTKVTLEARDLLRPEFRINELE